MKRLWWASFVIVLVLLVKARPVGALDASPNAILTNPDRFDGKSVTIHGTITNLRETVSRRGNPYYTFDLSDGMRTVRVFSFGGILGRAFVRFMEAPTLSSPSRRVAVGSTGGIRGRAWWSRRTKELSRAKRKWRSLCSARTLL